MPHHNVRVATGADIEDLVRMSYLFHSESPFANRVADDDEIRNLISHLLSRKPSDAIVLVSTDDDTPVGMLAGVATKTLFNKERFASEVVWWVDPEYRRGPRGKDLAAAYDYWAEHVAGCALGVMTALADDRQEVIGRLYERKGYSKMETAYMKEF